MRKILMSLLIVIMCSCIACGSNEEDADSSGNVQQENSNIGENSEGEKNELSILTLEKAKETDAEEFVYTLYEEAAYITEFIGTSEIVVIPNEIEGCPVVKIGNTSFRNNENVKAVKIGNNVEIVGDSAFLNCTSLQFVIFGENIKTVENYAFAGCPSLIEIKLNEGLLTIGDLAFSGTQIPLLIPRSVIEIGLSGLSQPVQVYSGSYAESYVIEYAKEWEAVGFEYEVIE